MQLEIIKEKVLRSQQYDFLRENEHLCNNVILLGLGGSYAYGTNIETSDIDVRGVALNRKQEILTNENFEQFINEDTDTTVYSFNKIITLLSNCNPNTVEILGLKPEHYLYLSSIGRELLDNKKLFLSKRAVYSFGGYANQQLRRLSNKAARLVGQTENEQYILKTIQHAKYDFKEKYFEMPDDAINLYTDKAIQKDYDTEIFMDINLQHYPLRDWKAMWSEMHSIVKSYSKIGKRNEKAIEHGKLGKHMMHLIRLYMMCLDILENEEIVTCRGKEHDLLMDIRNGKYLDENRQPIPEFFDMVDEYEKRLDYAKDNTSLPDNPDYKSINEFVASVNERVVRNEV
ncbi:nucleotidyltransferase domain-containing protein [Lachnospiraceae bacterium 54-53]